MPAHGTPDLLILSVKPGACLAMPRLRSTRPVVYNPEFSDDIAATMRIAWITLAIHGMPIRPNTVTNGLMPGVNSLVGRMQTSRSSAPQ